MNKLQIYEPFHHLQDEIRLFNLYSQAGEDGALEAIFRRIGTDNRYCVECGAADGLYFSNTRKLIDEGWNSLQIEGHPEKYRQLAERYATNHGGRVVTKHAMVKPMGPDSFASIFASYYPELPEDFDLLVIDVDGQDYYLWNSLTRYRPRVVAIEYDPNADPMFVPEMEGVGQAGVQAIYHLARSRGYRPVIKTQWNIISVREDLVPKLTSPLANAGPGWETPPIRRVKTDEPMAPNVHIKDPKTGNQALVSVTYLLSMPRLGFNAHWLCLDIAAHSTGYNIPMIPKMGGVWYQQIQRGLNYGIKQGADWIICLDYDSVYTAQDLIDLMTLAVRYPEVGAIVPWQIKRGGGDLPILNLRENGQVIRQVPAAYFEGEISPIAMGHFGMTLIKTAALKAVPKPWLLPVPNADGEWETGKIDDDVYFWYKLQDCGVRVVAANDIRIGHIDEDVAYLNRDMQTVHQTVPDFFKSGKPSL